MDAPRNEVIAAINARFSWYASNKDAMRQLASWSLTPAIVFHADVSRRRGFLHAQALPRRRQTPMVFSGWCQHRILRQRRLVVAHGGQQVTPYGGVIDIRPDHRCRLALLGGANIHKGYW